MAKPAKNTICLWYDKDALAAARFYAKTFPDSKVGEVFKAPSDFPSGKEGDVLTVLFTVLGIPCLGLNWGPQFKQTEAFSLEDELHREVGPGSAREVRTGRRPRLDDRPGSPLTRRLRRPRPRPGAGPRGCAS
jgi:hypothetical protein